MSIKCGKLWKIRETSFTHFVFVFLMRRAMRMGQTVGQSDRGTARRSQTHPDIESGRPDEQTDRHRQTSRQCLDSAIAPLTVSRVPFFHLLIKSTSICKIHSLFIRFIAAGMCVCVCVWGQLASTSQIHNEHMVFINHN